MLPSEQTNVSLPGSPVRAKNRKEQFFVSIAGFVLAPHEFRLFVPTWTARPGADGRPCYPERAQVLDAARLYLSDAYMPSQKVVRRAHDQGADIVEAALRKSEEEMARRNAMVEEHNGLANSRRKAWCCVNNAALRRGPELDSEIISRQQLEKGTHVEVRRSPLPR